MADDTNNGKADGNGSGPGTAAVVLGSGGARGYAHIGALEVIEQRGF